MDVFEGQPRTPFTSAKEPKKQPIIEFISWTILLGIGFPSYFILKGKLPEWLIITFLVLLAVTIELIKMRVISRPQRAEKKPDFPPPPIEMKLTPEEVDAEVLTWRKLLDKHSPYAWVLFSYGTCVLIPERVSDPKAAATEHLGAYGSVEIGTPSGDMVVIQPIGLENEGVVVGFHSPLIFVFVPAIWTLPQNGLAVAGVVGRNRRHFDSQALQVIHVEPGVSRAIDS